MNHSTELVVALDFKTAVDAEKMIEQLQGLPIVYKIGLELFLATGQSWVKALAAKGHQIFLDLKLHDIPNTVASSIAQIEQMGVSFTTVHLMGGEKMLQAIQAKRNSSCAMKILGVSVLTSWDHEAWKNDFHETIEESAEKFSKQAHHYLDGMVCSPLEVVKIKKKFPHLFLMVPGIRLPMDGNPVFLDDQARVTTPQDAAKSGASAIVVGRPIITAHHPRKVTEQILELLQKS